MPRKLLCNLAFEAFLIAALLILTLQAGEWQSQTRLFPYAVGRFALLLTIIIFIQELFALRKHLQSPPAKAPERKEGDPQDENSAPFVTRALRDLFWLAGYGLFIILIGFIGGTAAFLFLYFRFRAAMSWLRAGLWAAGATTIMSLIFVELAGMRDVNSVLRWLLT